MDESAFDRLARIVGHAAPRRALLALAGGLSQALLIDEFAWSKKRRKKKERKKKKKKKNRKKGQACVRTTPSSGATYSAQSTYKGKKLVLSESAKPFGENGATGGKLELTHGGSSVVSVDTAISAGVMTVTVTFGNAVSGIKRSTFTNDGKTVTGEVDGRAIVPLPADADPGSVQFADGAPPPNVKIDPALQKAIGTLLSKAASGARQCDSGRAARRSGKQRQKAVRGSRNSSTRRPRQARGNDVGTEDVDPKIQPECLALQLGCHAGWVICQAGVAAGCLATVFGYGICFGIGSFTCLAAHERCRREARHNAPCCPVRCGGDPENSLWGDDPSCCTASETCLDPNDNRKGCCAEGFRSCHGQSCCAGDQDCESDGICCRRGYSSCGGTCCPDGSCLEGSCCAPPSGVACGGTCCPPFTRSCCNDSCCDGDCVNNRICCKAPNVTCGNNCCAPGKCCDGVCCGNDETCVNNVCQQVCSPTLHETCPNLPGYPTCCLKGTICCSSGECCPNFAPVCCGDSCCLPNQECCPDNVCRSTCLR